MPYIIDKVNYRSTQSSYHCIRSTYAGRVQFSPSVGIEKTREVSGGDTIPYRGWVRSFGR